MNALRPGHLSQNPLARRSTVVNVDGELVAVASPVDRPGADLETIFLANYSRISRVIARLVRDHARAEELAVDVFLKWSHHPSAHGADAVGWLYRTAVRSGLDELRRAARRARLERLLAAFRRSPPTPADVHASSEEQRRVRAVLAVLKRRDAELLVMRSHGLSYAQLAEALAIQPTSVGTLLARAERAFRTEYVRRYGSV